MIEYMRPAGGVMLAVGLYFAWSTRGVENTPVGIYALTVTMMIAGAFCLLAPARRQ